MSRILFGSIGVDPLTTLQATGRVIALVGKTGGTVFTPNIHHAALAEQDRAFAAAYRSAALCLCDGTPLRWALALQSAVPERIAGSTFLPLLLELAAQHRWRVAFIGGREQVAQRLPALLHQRYAGIQTALISEPTRRLTTEMPESLKAVIPKLKAAAVQLVCVSLPSPMQEVWAKEAHTALGGGVFVCTGSAIDRLVGASPTPPRWLGAAGLEWMWRVWQEPGRLGPRYAADLRAFVPLLVRFLSRKQWAK